jgi:hypothetical protein
MRKNTSVARLFPAFRAGKIAAAVVHSVQRTKAKQTVKIRFVRHAVTGEILTPRVLKK